MLSILIESAAAASIFDGKYANDSCVVPFLLYSHSSFFGGRRKQVEWSLQIIGLFWFSFFLVNSIRIFRLKSNIFTALMIKTLFPFFMQMKQKKKIDYYCILIICIRLGAIKTIIICIDQLIMKTNVSPFENQNQKIKKKVNNKIIELSTNEE